MSDREICGFGVFPLTVPLIAPFKTASSAPSVVTNFAICIRLVDGTEGWGETPILPPITAETVTEAPTLLENQLANLLGRDATQWRCIAIELDEQLPGYGAVRAGIEMALIDAFARSYQLPLCQLFGGCGQAIITDITIPICAPSAAQTLAAEYKQTGFKTLKIKIGLDLDADCERLVAIHNVHPNARLIVDANAGYSANEMLALLRELRARSITPALLEQPVPRDDWDGMIQLTREAGVPIAADESCRHPEDVVQILRNQAAQVINIKLAKSGVVNALRIAETARSGGLGLMIGGMVETRLAMGFSAHFASGLGGFQWIDLDTPLLLRNDPIQGGCQIVGSRYQLDVDVVGHGASLKPTTL